MVMRSKAIDRHRTVRRRQISADSTPARTPRLQRGDRPRAYALSGGERFDLVEGSSEPVTLDLEFVAALQVQPEPLARSEVPGKTKGGIGGDAALSSQW
jgi:hypothetical protein